MNIRDFEYIIAIDETKSFIKASKKCFISQPALSQQVKKIEDQLDFRIFERDKKNIITTQKGKKFIKYARLIIHNYDKIKEISNGVVSLKIGLIPTICPYLLPHIVKDLNKKLSQIKFYFLELKTHELIAKLKSGDIDVGILAHRADVMDQKLNYDKLYDEEFMLALPKNSKLDESDFSTLIDERKLILLEEGNCMSDNIKEICSIYDQNSFSDFYATNIETVKNMIKVNNGAALLPKLSCLNEDELKISKFKSKKTREIGIINRVGSSETKILTKQIKEIISDSIFEIL